MTRTTATQWVWAVPSTWLRFIVWLISWPLIAVMFVTVPDCRQSRWKRWFLVTFLTSIAWIGVYSYLMVWMISIIGEFGLGRGGEREGKKAEKKGGDGRDWFTVVYVYSMDQHQFLL